MFRRESFGLTFGTRGVFRRKDRRVWFEACRKGLSGRWLPGWLPGQMALSEGRSGRGFGGSFERGHPAGLRDDSEGFIGRVLREYVSLSERLRKALSGWHVPKGFSKGSSGKASAAGGYGRWIQNGRLRFIG